MSTFQPFAFEKECLHTQSGITFKTVVEDYVFYQNDDQPEASIYSYSYIAQPSNDPGKPVMFCYNGGPGASSSWVHMGLLGPKQVTFPHHPGKENHAAEYGENQNFLLDCCDLVMINPPGTQYTFVTKEAGKKYFSTAGDAEAIVEFILAWLKKYGREHAPVYLLGESYGTIRNLAVADLLMDQANLAGIVSIGTSFNVGSPTTMLVEPNVRRLGANAACCWFHLHRDEKPLVQFVQEAMDFAYGEYAHALLLGSRLPAEEMEQTLEKLHHYTGLDKELLRDGGLRFDEMTYLTKMMPGQLISAYDSRVMRPLQGEMTEEEWNEAFSSEPFVAMVDGPINQALAQYTRDELAEPENREAEFSMLQIATEWGYDTLKKDTITLPGELMERSDKLRIFFVAGYYDLQSTFDFVTYFLGRYPLPKDRVMFRVYETGHATYVGGTSAGEVSEDIRSFIKAGK
ncbi:MAG: S10 family serine carboxypeptidase-like protein [Acutalibacter sp.]|jgi:carboxypeptidase C (cathepsin A)